MANEMELYGAHSTAITQKRGNYVLAPVMGGEEVTLKRGVDFALLPKNKAPSLLKSGAEKVVRAYGLLPRFSIASSIEENAANPFFFYNIKCELVKIHPQSGQEYVFSSAYGSANTGESRNGLNSAYNAANATLKMAQKRALVAAAITIGGISDLFSQDMENEKFMDGYTEIVNTQDEESSITAKQVKRLYALGNEAGLNAAQLKAKLAAMGITSTKDIKQKDYEDICKKIGELNG